MRETKNFTPDQAVEFAMRLHMAGRFEEAAKICWQVLIIDPDHVEAHNELGIALSEMWLYEKDGTAVRRHHESLYHLNRALRKNPNHHVVLTNRGVVLFELGEYEAGLVDLRRSVQIRPKNPTAWHNLGNVLERLERYPESLHAFEKVLHLDPRHESGAYCQGVVYRKIGRIPEALRAFERAVSLNQNDAEAHYNRAAALLISGDLEQGFREYEWRFRTVEYTRPLYGPFPQPRWVGEDISDKTLLIAAEQGIGDTIQFLRYVPLAVERARQVILAVHDPIRPLLNFRGVEVLVPGQAWPAFDYQVNMLSLPHALGNPDIPEPWKPDVVGALRVGRDRVGLCWSGFWRHKNDRHRSIPLKDFMRLATPEPEFVSLQKDIRMDDEEAFAGSGMAPLPPDDSFARTAGIIAGLDLVISVDTAVAHMAATLGVPTWILVPAHATDWRWQTDRHDSPWYPSVRLFRQQKIGDWAPTLDEVRNELAKRVQSEAEAA